jgi:predicted N-acetyltransferase YhbS
MYHRAGDTPGCPARDAVGHHAGRLLDMNDVRIEPYTGSRAELRSSFELAEDSPAQLDAYLTAGRVLVAWRGGVVVGHLQLVETDRRGEVELKNMAVAEELRGQGIGAGLVREAVALLTAESVSVLVVATAAADIGNLRFYQRQGFRMRAIERDAFTAATGYAPGILIDGIELRDRVWLDRQLGPTA